VNKLVNGNGVTCVAGPPVSCTVNGMPQLGDIAGKFTLNLYAGPDPAAAQPPGFPVTVPIPPNFQPNVPPGSVFTLCETVPTGWAIPVTNDVTTTPNPLPVGYNTTPTVFAHPTLARTACWLLDIPLGTDTFTVNINNTPVAARISINPPSDTNAVDDPHTFTVKVESSVDGGGTWQPVVGAKPAVTFTPSNPDSITDNCADPVPSGTNASGECTVVINNADAEAFTANAAVTVNVEGESIQVQTNGTGGSSGPAVKTYVDANILLTPQTATNEVDDNHVITVEVNQNLGGGGGFVDANGVNVQFSTSTSGSRRTCIGPSKRQRTKLVSAITCSRPSFVERRRRRR